MYQGGTDTPGFPFVVLSGVTYPAHMHEIIYYYSAHSAFAYLGSVRLSQICASHNVTLIHRPIPLSPVVEAQGSVAFRDRTQASVDYFFGREIERWADWRSAPVVPYRPTFHDAGDTLASGMILALGDICPAVDPMAHAILQAHWRDDADVSNVQTLTALARDLGHDGAALIKRAQSSEIADRYAENGALALAANIFGSPTYLVNGEVFYGQDRLEMPEHALTKPFAPTRWRNPRVN